MALRGFGLTVSAVPGVRPGGRPTFLCGQESRQRNRPCSVAPRCARGPLRCSQPKARAELTSLRSVQTAARSQSLMRAARAPWVAALLGSSKGEPRNSPTAKPASRSQRGISLSPFSTAEERKVLRPCAQRTSTSDFARLSERSVAKRVPREASRPEYRRAPAAQRRAVRSGVVSLPTFLSTQESRSPAGANSPHGPGH